MPGSRRSSTSGYDQYQKSLLEVPYCTDYGDPSSDDLSSEWDSDVPETRKESAKVLNLWPKFDYMIYKPTHPRLVELEINIR